MELVSPDHLDAILEVLREHGVSSFSCAAFSVALGNEAPVAEPTSTVPVGELIKTRPAADTFARGIYANPHLWAGGTPPQFPKKAP